jgi:hypothetical protein
VARTVQGQAQVRLQVPLEIKSWTKCELI